MHLEQYFKSLNISMVDMLNKVAYVDANGIKS